MQLKIAGQKSPGSICYLLQRLCQLCASYTYLQVASTQYSNEEDDPKMLQL